MSRPTSYHDNQRHDTGVYNGDNFALPLFNYPAPDASPAHSSGYRSASHQDLPQPSTQPPVPPPAARSPYHQSRQSVSHNQSLSSPYNPSSPLTPATSASQHYRQGSMSSALPHSAVPFPQANRSDLMLPPPASTSLGSLARSASLGRRKDPYAYSPDDVESGLGSMDMSSATPPWPGYGGRAPPHSPRDVIMSPNRPISNNNMNPPPLPTHNLTRPGAVTRDSGGSASPTRPPYASHAHRDSFSNNPYIPRGPDPGPSVPVITGTQQAQWTDHRRPVGQRVQSSSSFTQPSPSSDQLSPYLKPSLPGTSPHSPINNPYDLSPRYDNPPTLPASPHHNTAGWYEGDVAMPSSPLFDTRTLSAQQYPASQPATPAARPYDSGPPRGQPLRVRSGDVSRQSKQGFKQVRDLTDLQPQIKVPNVGRRADSDAPGKFISPLKCLTAQLPQTYALCSPQFRYETSDNPRRVLTKPSKPVHNDGADNEDWDYILYVNDVLGGEGGRDRYLILDVLGQGTFGQVVKCQNMRTHEIIAVKVVKNKPAYLNQSKMEVAILELLNREYDPNDTHHIIRMIESFTHKNHLCLVFECLSSNLYELIKQNQFKGLSTQLVKVFTQQLLESLAVLKDARLIHCDLKPENILLKTLQSPQIKVIDFGSACHEMQTVYTYIQSRFYRSPEVLLGLPYSTSIDMWSLGCIVVELFLGLPLFPGTSEYNQVSRIVDMLGNPPGHLLEVGKQTHEFFNYTGVDAYGKKQYVLKSMDQYATEHRTKEQPSKQYFKQTKLTEIIMEYPYSKKNQKQSDIDKEMANRRAFVDFVKGLLNLDPIQRWSPQQAAKHPFITGEKFTGPYQPATSTIKKAQTPTEPIPATTPTKKYGGLVQSPSSNRGQRVYSDAAAYNQQLAQHQSYTAQAQAQAQAASARPPPFSPGYDMRQAQSQSQQSPYSQRVPSQTHQSRPSAGQGQWQQQMPPPQPNFGQARVPSMSTSSSHASMRNNAPMVTAQTNPPPNSYYPQSRNRANTINQMDAIPPALARLTHFGAPDPSGTRNLTPVMNRDDAIREWERRQAGHSKTSSMAHTSYPQLEYLQEQAELATMSGQSWMFPTPYGHVMPSAGGHSRRPSGHAHSQSMSAHPAYSMQPPIGASPHHASSSAAPDYRRGQVSEYDPPLSAQPAQSSSSRAAYLPTYPPPAATSAPNSAFDAFDTRDQNLGMMYTPLQPNQASYNYAPPPHPGHHGHGQRASYSGPYHNGQGAALPGGNNPFAQNQPSSSPRYQRRSQQYGA